MAEFNKKLKLHGFNNLTKTLTINIYDICYAKSVAHKSKYIEYIDEVYNAEQLTQILTNITKIIGANILNIARQDYDPQGASVTMLIAEHEAPPDDSQTKEEPGPLPQSVVAHLDKSHVTVHTYPESHPDDGISTFRADIEISTCGLISPLRALNYIIHCFDSDIVTMDYHVRGFTRDTDGTKHFIDHAISSIQSYLSVDTQELYSMIDVNVYQENIFHTKMLLKSFELDNYLFGDTLNTIAPEEQADIKRRLRREMLEIFYGRNIPEEKKLPQHTGNFE
ncbi:MAG: adenosylmethionine decarboxylase [Gammaproteobacteria bacterium]|nr:adenosylmethionine decarboxylase [Gammaproteobacteria bacterium]